MAGYTIILSPICAIMIIDYWIVKREKIDVPSLYRLNGRYFYWNGIVRVYSADTPRQLLISLFLLSMYFTKYYFFRPLTELACSPDIAVHCSSRPPGADWHSEPKHQDRRGRRAPI